MQFFTSLNQKLDHHHLLKHPFYQSWNQGALSIETLQNYATEYYSHVAAFPRYISAIHTLCPDIESRQVLLGNLVEEESGEENHPELWKRFAEGLGIPREKLNASPTLESTKNLVDGYFELVKSDYATGLGALYAYERQTPEVSESKIEGLKKHYGIKDARSLQFFQVHMTADEWHTAEVAGLIGSLNEGDKQKSAQGAEVGAKLLWNFLDGIVESRRM
jgi:pyrroloquinoline-quinone synthase